MHHILPEHTHYMQYTVGTSAPFTVRRSVNADTPTAAPHQLPQPASPSAKKGHHNHTPCNLTTGVLSHAGIMSRGEPNWGSPFGRWGPSQGLLPALLTPAAMHVCVRVLGKPANCARQPHAMDSPRQLTTSPRPLQTAPNTKASTDVDHTASATALKNQKKRSMKERL
jgi:hypothetical protein